MQWCNGWVRRTTRLLNDFVMTMFIYTCYIFILCRFVVIILIGISRFANIACVSRMGESVKSLSLWGHVVYGIGISRHGSCDSVLDSDLLFLFVMHFF